MFLIKNGQLIMYDISKPYKDYLRNFDNKVSMKDTRKFYGIIVTQNNIDYCIPFTSKINKKTNPKLTVNIKDNGYIIAKLLLNNMIPVNLNDCIMVNINKEKYKNYFLKEIQYLRNPNIIAEILRKTEDIYNVIKDPTHKDFSFFNKICCNFPLLEEKCKEWGEVQSILPTLQYIKNENDLFYIYDNLNDKNNFDRIIKMLDNDTLSKNINIMNIKDLENKRIPSIQEITTSVYEKIKDIKEVNFDDLLNNLESFLNFSDEFQNIFNDDKFIKPLSEQEIENIKIKSFEYIKNLYSEEETDVEETLDDEVNEKTENINEDDEDIIKPETKINQDSEKTFNIDELSFNTTIQDINFSSTGLPSEEDLNNNINTLLDDIGKDINAIDWNHSKITLENKIIDIFDNDIKLFIEGNESQIDEYFKIIPDIYKTKDLNNKQILSDFLSDKITDKFGKIEDIINKQEEEGEDLN